MTNAEYLRKRYAASAEVRARRYAANERWRKANMERKAALSMAWNAANQDYVLANNAKRRSAKLKRTPPWFGELDALVMIEAHDLAKLRGGWHVDHVVPLQGERVSGLHVYNNIQVIPASANCAKSNHF